MKHSLTICMITGRDNPEVMWLLESLLTQIQGGEDVPQFIIVSPFEPQVIYFQVGNRSSRGKTIAPKPTIWQGPHRKTREDWWSASSARNSSLCHAQTEWVMMLDDRCVLGPDSLTAIREAMDGGYAVAGAYEKHHNMRVENGAIVDPGTISGVDNRLAHIQGSTPMRCAGNWCYGAMALPLEWALTVGGYEQALDGMGAEDTAFGIMLQNNGFPLCYDPRFLMIQDRTPSACGKTYRREDKGISPQDKSHRSLELFGSAMHTTNRHQLWQSRQAVLAGKPFPVLLDSATDWYDGEVIDENYFKPKPSNEELAFIREQLGT